MAEDLLAYERDPAQSMPVTHAEPTFAAEVDKYEKQAETEVATAEEQYGAGGAY